MSAQQYYDWHREGLAELRRYWYGTPRLTNQWKYRFWRQHHLAELRELRATMKGA